MDPETHLKQIRTRFAHGVTVKYEKGQREHGGHLWEKPGMLGRLRDELLDFAVYEHTLRDQLEDLLRDLRTLGATSPKVRPLAARLAAILQPPSD